MADDLEPSSKRAEKRKTAEARREVKAAYREALFQALASGWTTRQIADASTRPIASFICRSRASPRRCAWPTSGSTGANWPRSRPS